MPTDTLAPLKPLINSRAYAALRQQGMTIAKLMPMTLHDLDEIEGIGDRWATDIRTALDSLQPVPAVAQPPDDSLDADYADVDAPTALEPDGKTEPVLAIALRYLRECNRDADAAVLKGKVDRDGEAAVVETAIAILEGLPGGELPRNLAQDLRDRMSS